MNSEQLRTLRDAVLKGSMIMGVVCVTLGGAMVIAWGISQQVARKEADAQTIVELQKRIDVVQKQLTAKERELADYALLAKASQNILRNQRDYFEARLKERMTQKCPALSDCEELLVEQGISIRRMLQKEKP